MAFHHVQCLKKEKDNALNQGYSRPTTSGHPNKNRQNRLYHIPSLNALFQESIASCHEDLQWRYTHKDRQTDRQTDKQDKLTYPFSEHILCWRQAGKRIRWITPEPVAFFYGMHWKKYEWEENHHELKRKYVHSCWLVDDDSWIRCFHNILAWKVYFLI